MNGRSSCVGCHNLINPLGHGFSNFDAFGRFIDQEPVLSQTDVSIDGYVPVNSQVDLSDIFGPGYAANDAVELSRVVANQETTKACFAQKFMNYSMGREVSSEADGCRLDRIYNNLDSNARMVDVLRAAAMDREFRLRRIDQ